MPESALIVPVPEAEPFIGRWRDHYDPTTRLGVPAHITLLFPFMSPQRIDEALIERVQAIVGSVRRFTFRLAGIGRFPTALYLAPEPAAPFVELTTRLFAAFPEFPPYAGAHASVVPHLTVAQAPVPSQLEGELLASLPASGFPALCNEVALIANSSGRWQRMHAFSLV